MTKLLAKKEEEDFAKRQPDPIGRAILIRAARRALQKTKHIVKHREKENCIDWRLHLMQKREADLAPRLPPAISIPEEPVSQIEPLLREVEQEQIEKKQKDRAAKRKCLEEFSGNRVHIIRGEPNCPNCFQSKRQGRLMWDQGKIICTACPYQQPNSSFTSTMKNSVLKVRTTGPFMLPVLLPSFESQPNNVREKMGPYWGPQNTYLSSCPDYGECSFTDFSSI